MMMMMAEQEEEEEEEEMILPPIKYPKGTVVAVEYNGQDHEGRSLADGCFYEATINESNDNSIHRLVFRYPPGDGSPLSSKQCPDGTWLDLRVYRHFVVTHVLHVVTQAGVKLSLGTRRSSLPDFILKGMVIRRRQDETVQIYVRARARASMNENPPLSVGDQVSVLPKGRNAHGGLSGWRLGKVIRTHKIRLELRTPENRRTTSNQNRPVVLIGYDSGGQSWIIPPRADKFMSHKEFMSLGDKNNIPKKKNDTYEKRTEGGSKRSRNPKMTATEWVPFPQFSEERLRRDGLRIADFDVDLPPRMREFCAWKGIDANFFIYGETTRFAKSLFYFRKNESEHKPLASIKSASTTVSKWKREAEDERLRLCKIKNQQKKKNKLQKRKQKLAGRADSVSAEIPSLSGQTQHSHDEMPDLNQRSALDIGSTEDTGPSPGSAASRRSANPHDHANIGDVDGNYAPVLASNNSVQVKNKKSNSSSRSNNNNSDEDSSDDELYKRVQNIFNRKRPGHDDE
mmetsp:Transcript_38526/g.93357  ORF Transcript_38526/g.93357 Transcript_38526/m.93357 type:complete len:513 (+) Transcript_38526:281-1819(+)